MHTLIITVCPFGIDGTEVGLGEHLFLCVLPILDYVLTNNLAYIVALAVGLSHMDYLLRVWLVFAFVLNVFYLIGEVHLLLFGAA
jgi:hypothetical protein